MVEQALREMDGKFEKMYSQTGRPSRVDRAGEVDAGAAFADVVLKVRSERLLMEMLTTHRGQDRVGWVFVFGCTAYDLIRLGNRLPAPPPA